MGFLWGAVWGLEDIPKGVHSCSRRAGACLPPKSGDATGGRKARCYAELVRCDFTWCEYVNVRIKLIDQPRVA